MADFTVKGKDITVGVANFVVALGAAYVGCITGGTSLTAAVVVPPMAAFVGEVIKSVEKKKTSESLSVRSSRNISESYKGAFSRCAKTAWIDTIDQSGLKQKEKTVLKEKACVWDEKAYEIIFQQGIDPHVLIQETVEDVLTDCDIDSDCHDREDYLAAMSRGISQDFFCIVNEMIMDSRTLRPLVDTEEIKTALGSLQEQIKEGRVLQEQELENKRYLQELISDLLEKQDTTSDKTEQILQIVKLLLSFMVVGDKEKEGSSLQSGPTVTKPVRQIAENLWVNWQTGCIAQDFESVVSTNAFECGLDDASSTKVEASAVRKLSPSQLRLLSILVQGEGAVVRWEVLEKRRRVMQSKKDAEGDHFPETAQEAVRDLYAVIPELKDLDLEDDGNKRIAERGCRIKRFKPSMLISSQNDLFSSYKGCSSEEDWDRVCGCKITEIDRNKGEAMTTIVCKDDAAGFRRYYNDLCNDFEVSFSNAPNASFKKEGILGKYSMAEVYVNAYASESGSSDSDRSGGSDHSADSDNNEVLLDFVEEWYNSFDYTREEIERKRGDIQKLAVELDFDRFNEFRHYLVCGNVCVLHGHPGDGKTTFCKKAVYAHCKEGWLPKVPHVLRFSLNPSESDIVQGGSLDLTKALCMDDKGVNVRYSFSPEHFKEAEKLKGSLVIFDGYDELSSSLSSDDKANSFYKFYGKVVEFAENYSCNAIITSRSMCIEKELKDPEFQNKKVVSFAPLTKEGQDDMIGRMIELDEQYEDDDPDEAGKMPLQKYRDTVLEGFRNNPKLDKLNELLRIPILFRMIVAARFRDVDGTQTRADLYQKLFHNLLTYKSREGEEKELVGKFEELAGRIFLFDNSTCPFGKNEEDLKYQHLVYVFMTKSDGNSGQLGFLHPSFRDYFHARYIVSQIKSGNPEKIEVLFRSLRARQITDLDQWDLVKQVVGLKDDEDMQVQRQDIENVLSMLSEKKMAAALLCGEYYEPGSKAEADSIKATENAIVNLLGACAAIENGCLAGTAKEQKSHGYSVDTESKDGRIRIANYPELCLMLQRGDYHEIYLEGINLAGCDLKGARLKDAHLSGAYLEGAHLEGAHLEGAKLSGAHLEHASFQRANLDKAVLVKAFFEETDFSGASMIGAILKKTNLKGAIFHGSSENDIKTDVELTAVLVKADLEEAEYKGSEQKGSDQKENERKEDERKEDDQKGSDQKESNLKVVDLKGLDLRGANLRNAKFEKAHLDGANLSGAVMIGAKLEGASLIGTNLESAYMNSAVLKNAHLEEAYLRNASLDRAALNEAHLSDAYLKGASLRYAKIDEELLAYAKERGAFDHHLQSATERMLDSFTSRRYDDLSWRLRSVRIGDRMPFGRYPVEANGDEEPLIWRVLEIKDGKALLITEKLIDAVEYNKEWDDVTWETCTLRKWLNDKDFIDRKGKGSFFLTAFTDEEKARIALKTNENPDNSWFETKGGEPTKDKIFALSINEARKYFKSDSDRMAAKTPYSVKNGAEDAFEKSFPDGEKTGWWWLRSPGRDCHIAACVHPSGGFYVLGGFVDGSSVCVRPALWLNL